MSRSSHCTSGFDHSPMTASPWPILAVLRAMWDAFRDGLAAYRQYECLRSKRIPHDTALREAIGIGIIRSNWTREAVQPLCFAGKG
jgi:hypothetical protein